VKSTKEILQENFAAEKIEFQKKIAYEHCTAKGIKSHKEIALENYAANSKNFIRTSYMKSQKTIS
jgi:hypothetical protein